MGSLEKVVERFKTMDDKLHAFFVPTEEELKSFFDMEAGMQTSSGMPMINRSLEESVKREHHICIIQKKILDWVPHHHMTMVDSKGNIVGFDIIDGLEEDIYGRDDLIWLSDDFVMLPDACQGEVFIVLHPCPITLFDDDPEVNDMILMFPAAPVDDLIRDTYGIPHVRDYNSAIVSFNGPKR